MMTPPRSISAVGEANALLPALGDAIERAAADDDAVPLRFLPERLGVRPVGQRHPKREAGLRRAPGHVGRQRLAQRGLERIAAGAVAWQHLLQVRLEVAALEELGERVLEQRRGAQIHRVLEQLELAAQGARRQQVADAQRGDQLLAVGAEVQHLAVERAQRRHRRLAVEVQVRRVVVFDERHAGAV
jgi:hypothetical protein